MKKIIKIYTNIQEISCTLFELLYKEIVAFVFFDEMRKRWFLYGSVLVFWLLFAFVAFAAPNQDILDFCATQKDMKCPVNIADDLAPIEKKFLHVKQSLQNKPLALVGAQVARMLDRSYQTESTPIEELKTRYLRRRLEQRQAEIREKMETISLSPTLVRSLRSKYVTDAQFFHALRQYIIPRLVSSWFTKFATKPYGSSSGLYVDIDWQFYVDQITLNDDLDIYLARRRKNNKWANAQNISLYLTPQEIKKFSSVYLFKNKEDLQKLWYSLVSNRARTNTDQAYRRFNIKTAFDAIWPVRVLLPGTSLSFLTESHFDIDRKELYKWWKVISSDEEVDDYGWGLCGAATALYQGTVTNAGLEMKMRNHSKRYRNLYTATIDGQRQATPGIDATIFYPWLDLVITNSRTYPIILVMNYDGTYKWLESVFTLWKSGDTGSLEYVWKRTYKATLNVKGWEKKTVNGQCHSRLINGVKQERCYKEVK